MRGRFASSSARSAIVFGLPFRDLEIVLLFAFCRLTSPSIASEGPIVNGMGSVISPFPFPPILVELSLLFDSVISVNPSSSEMICDQNSSSFEYEPPSNQIHFCLGYTFFTSTVLPDLVEPVTIINLQRLSLAFLILVSRLKSLRGLYVSFGNPPGTNTLLVLCTSTFFYFICLPKLT